MRVAWISLTLAVGCGGSSSGSMGGSDTDGSGGTSAGATSSTTPTSGGTSAGTSGSTTAAETDGTSGGEEDPDAPWRSGSRMRAIVWDGGDGATRFQMWYDSELEVACTTLTLAGGERRCLPVEWAEELYADDACTQRVFTPRCPDQVPPLVFSEGGSFDCEGGWDEVFELAPLPVGTTYQRQTDGSCTELQTMVDRYSLEEADLTPYFSFTSSVRDRGARLGVRVDEGSDGSHRARGVVDLERDRGCVTPSNEETGLCTVGLLGQTDYIFTDAACSGEPVAIDSKPDPACPPLAVKTLDGELHEIGEDLSAATLYTGNPDSCAALEEPLGDAYGAGPLVPDDFYAPVQLGRRGTGRLESTIIETTEGRALTDELAYYWRDDELGDCYPRPTPDGLWCMPLDINASPAGRYWGDAACSQTPLVAHAEPGQWHRMTRAGLCDPPFTTYSPTLSVFTEYVAEVGPAFDGEVYQVDPDTDECVSIGDAGGTYFTITEVDLEMFAPVQERIE